jgi:hypothetical protein
MNRREQTRRYWRSVVARYERAGLSQAQFAEHAQVGLAALQYWIYKLRQETTALVTATPTDAPRLLPVVVDAARSDRSESTVEVDVGGVRVRLAGTPDVRYVAALVGALQARAC